MGEQAETARNGRVLLVLGSSVRATPKALARQRQLNGGNGRNQRNGRIEQQGSVRIRVSRWFRRFHAFFFVAEPAMALEDRLARRGDPSFPSHFRPFLHSV